MKSIYVWLSLVLLLLAGCEQEAGPLAATNAAPPTITSDKADYAPGELVTLTGSNWQPSESVQIVVDDDGLDIEQPFKRTVTVLADESGTFTDKFNLPNWFVADYKVTATGEVSGTATHTFTDALIASATIVPNSIIVGSSEALKVKISNNSGTGSNKDVLGSAKVLLPEGYTFVSFGTVSKTNWIATYNVSDRKIGLKVGNSGEPVADGSSIEVVVNVTAPAISGSAIWTTEAWRTVDFTSPAFNVSSQPTVTVTAAPSPVPTLASITPASATQGNTLNVVFTGTNFKAGVSSVSFGDGITVNSTTVNSATQITANITVGAGAGTGARNVSVTNAAPVGGTATLTNGFTVNAACTVPSITTQPVGATKTVGESVTFSVVAAGTGLSYQWRKGDSDISGATAANYTIPAVAAADTGDYSVKVTGQCGSPVTSNAAALTVNKKTATLALSGLAYTYDGTPKAVAVTTTPADLSGVTLTYDGSATAPRDAGSYAVVAALDNSDYSASNAEGTLEIAKASQALNFTGAPATAVYGSTFEVSVTSGDFASDNPVVLEASGACTLDNKTVTMTSGSGICTLTANQAGDTNYSAAPEVKQQTQAQKADQTIIWSDPAPITYGTALGGDQLSASTNGGGSLTYNYEAGTKLEAGTYTLEVTAAATDNYNEATKTVSLTVNQAEQVIAWDAPAAITYGTPLGNDQLNASLTTGDGALSYDPPADTVLGADDHTLKVTVSATKNYKEASKTVSLKVKKANQEITFAEPESPAIYGSTFSVAASSSSNLPVSLSAGGGCTIDGVTVNMTSGTTACSLTASQAGDDNHNAAASVVHTVEAAKANATIVVKGYNGVYDGNPHGATGTAQGLGGENLNGLDLGDTSTNAGTYQAAWSFDGGENYNDASGSVDIVISKANANIEVEGYSGVYDGEPHGAKGSAIGVDSKDLSGGLTFSDSFTNAGTHTATWSFAGDTNHNPASGEVDILIAKANQTISFGALGGKTYGDSAFTVNATGGASGNAVTFAANGNCTVSGSSVSITGAGSCTVTASQAGNGNYNDAPAVSQSFSIAKANQTISFTGAPSTAVYGTSFSVAASSSAGLSVTVSASGSCSSSGTTVTMTSGSGTCSLSATQSGNDNYNSAQATQATSAKPLTIKGFYSPVDMGMKNNAKGGSTVPLKFEVFAGSTELTSTSYIKTFTQTLSCSTSVGDDIEEYATGNTSLRYDTTGGQFIFNWQTLKKPGTCYRVTVETQDGSKISADFQLR